MLGDSHLHIDAGDAFGDWMVKMLEAAKQGSIAIHFGANPVATITIATRNIAVDLLQPAVFQVNRDETGLFDKLKTASEFGRKLSENDLTVSFLRRGKEVVRLGKKAQPTFSKLLTKSDDLQLTSAREFGKLKDDLKTH